MKAGRKRLYHPADHCEESDCAGKVIARGKCSKHYMRWRRGLGKGYSKPVQRCPTGERQHYYVAKDGEEYCKWCKFPKPTHREWGSR